MQAFARFKRATELVVLLYTVAVASAQVAHFATDTHKRVYFALYLVGESWPECCLLVLGVILYFICKYFSLEFQTLRDDIIRRRLARVYSYSRLIIMSIVCISLIIVFFVESFYFVRARRVFWLQIAMKAYVESYKQKIDALARSGRLLDADQMLNVVTNTSDTPGEEQTLQVRRVRLALALSGSTQLYESSGSGPWNPVTQRMGYFKLVEALRLNPQNYDAAEKLRKRIQLLENRYLKADLGLICSSRGNLSSFRGFATSFLEARLRWIEDGSKAHCANDLQDLREAWQLDSAKCILAVSDNTRSRFDENVPVKNQVSCLNDHRLWLSESDSDVFASLHVNPSTTIGYDPSQALGYGLATGGNHYYY